MVDFCYLYYCYMCCKTRQMLVCLLSLSNTTHNCFKWVFLLVTNSYCCVNQESIKKCKMRILDLTHFYTTTQYKIILSMIWPGLIFLDQFRHYNPCGEKFKNTPKNVFKFFTINALLTQTLMYRKKQLLTHFKNWDVHQINQNIDPTLHN